MDYYYAVDGIVYIIDGSNRKRFEESKPELLVKTKALFNAVCYFHVI